jgi:hypothetical protein
MNDENLIHVAPETVQPDNNNDSEHAFVGKIARLPHDIRQQLNQRLFDGHTGPEILPWLNALPAVKEILDAHFKGVLVSPENLSNWRHGGYKRWCQEKQEISETENLGELAKKLTEAADGRLAPAAATVASGKILQFLKAANTKESNPDDIVKCAAAASVLLKGEQNYARLEIARERVRQRDDHLLLMRDRDQRNFIAQALRLLGDARAREIETSTSSYAEKIELLGIHVFDEFWESRPVSSPTPPGVPALNQES